MGAINDIVLRVIGLTSCMYAALDIKDDVLDRPYLPSDAAMLGRVTGVSPITLGTVWICIALLSTGYFLLLASRPKTHMAFGGVNGSFFPGVNQSFQHPMEFMHGVE